jgi:hypothetical protein
MRRSMGQVTLASQVFVDGSGASLPSLMAHTAATVLGGCSLTQMHL